MSLEARTSTTTSTKPALEPSKFSRTLTMAAVAFGALGLVSLVGLSGCTTSNQDDAASSAESDLRLKGTKNLGWIKDGETKIATYENPPSYRSYSFSATGGDLVIVDVKSVDGDRDPVAYITNDRYTVYAQHDDTLPDDFDAHVVYKVPDTWGKRNFRIAFNDAANQPSQFAVTLTIKKTDNATCDWQGQTVEEGRSFPSLDGCNTCTCTDDGVACTKKACVTCDPDNEPNRKYYGNPQTCMQIRFNCGPNARQFQNDCGCGCEKI